MQLQHETKREAIFAAILGGIIFLICLLGVCHVWSCPLPESEFADDWETPADPAEVPEVASLTAAIIRAQASEGAWFVCGSRLDGDAWDALATEIAWRAWVASLETGLDAAQLVATIWIESKFDPCAVGKMPRAEAVKAKIVPAQQWASITAKQAVAVANFWTGADVGFCQNLLGRYTPPRVTVESLFTVRGGISACVYHWNRMHAVEPHPFEIWRGFGAKTRERRTELLKWWIKRNARIL